MKKTLNTYEIAEALRQDTNAGWSYDGSKALAEYLEEYEESTGEEMELDVCAIRCDFSEFANLQEWADSYGHEYDKEVEEDEQEEEIRRFVQDHTTLIEFSGGVIVGEF